MLSRRPVVTTLGAVCMMGAPFVARLRDVDAITAIVCVATSGPGCFMVNYLAFASEASARNVSTAAGLLGGTGSLTGAAFMLVVGGTVERSGSFGIAFVLAGAMPLVALAGIW